MNQTTKKQHYIWRNYLAPWTDDCSNTGKIICLRNSKIFNTSLMNIAHENYFYGVKELSSFEKKIIYEMAINNVTGRQREVNQDWLNLYCAPYDLADDVVCFNSTMGQPTDRSEIESSQDFKNWNIEHIEKLHCLIESTGIPFLQAIRQNDLSFWEIEKSRNDFSFFLCTQYFRTKRTRDSVEKVLKIGMATYSGFENIRPANMWLPLSLIFASNLGAHITHNFSAVLLQTEDSCFIVGDQPVINTYSTFDMFTQPTAIELFYPVTPNTALLLTTAQKYTNGQISKINADAVAKYNELEVRASLEQVFATDISHLKMFVATN